MFSLGGDEVSTGAASGGSKMDYVVYDPTLPRYGTDLIATNRADIR
jgi:hypothetical protein